ncbi:hypothetical protein FSP39_004692 [Pinctada imbricata]|uniref:AAA+ ATPase domain-containing protein n=1 Tax=Pinctada imbricata TaxID=66713 RepID=A0AA89BU30_PINIB|nr:hypothetical protein FSP39_004692 [Pinctada imbricata]
MEAPRFKEVQNTTIWWHTDIFDFFYFSEAVSCLENTLEEGSKSSDIDIQSLYNNISRCHEIIHKLNGEEQEQYYSGILCHLDSALHSQKSLLKSKIDQLNEQSHSQTDKQNGSTKQEKIPVADAQCQNRRSAIEDTIITKGGLTFSDVAGLEDAKQTLREAIIMPLQFPQLFTGAVKPWKRILLYGPPGTGKSRLAQAISSEIQSTFYCVSSSDLVSSWVGESEKLIKELFHHAVSQKGRSVIFIDEIDSICRQRNSREEEYTRRIKTELLKQMEGADNSSQTDKIFLLCATNCPWELDSAFLRRFQKRIFIPLPDKETRIKLMKIHTKDDRVTLTEEEWSRLGDETKGFSGSDIANMILDALFCPIRDIQKSTKWVKRPDGMFSPCLSDNNSSTEYLITATIADLPPDKISPRDAVLGDFMASLATHKCTVTAAELEKFEEFTKAMGVRG